MAKEKTIYVCSSCGNEALSWQGKCSYCGDWNTLKEVKSQKAKMGSRKINNRAGEVVSLENIKTDHFRRINVGIDEVDRVLGGGIVPGSIILLGGDPGIGKSTLLLQLSHNLTNQGLNVLYVSGEESPEQIKMRAERIIKVTKQLMVLAETDLDNIKEIIIKQMPGIVIIDSIQTMFSADYPSTPGSIVQVRECALRFQQLAKTLGVSIVLVGHVTKGGEVAGPRMLEHLVDVVLYLEGERYHETRILRGVKNRFGATDEIAVLEMSSQGLEEVRNPSKVFLRERLTGVPGSVVTAAMEGSRPLLVEIQALTARTYFGYPRRTASGFDLNRLQLLVAVLQKRAGINLSDQDIYVNIVGGFKLKEPAADLAVCLAIASAYKNRKIDSKICAFGEVGLSGEIRSVPLALKRQSEAKKLGFSFFLQTKTLESAIKEALAGEL